MSTAVNSCSTRSTSFATRVGWQYWDVMANCSLVGITLHTAVAPDCSCPRELISRAAASSQSATAGAPQSCAPRAAPGIARGRMAAARGPHRSIVRNSVFHCGVQSTVLARVSRRPQIISPIVTSPVRQLRYRHHGSQTDSQPFISNLLNTNLTKSKT